MNNNVEKVRLVKARFSKRFCLKTDVGIRLTPWFKSYDIRAKGNFVKLITDMGTFVYHKSNHDLLYATYYDDEEINIDKLTENLYCLHINYEDNWSAVQFHDSNGNIYYKLEIENAYYMGNDLIAANELFGKWGLLDKNLDWKIRPVYEELFEFVNGFAFGFRSETNTTDIISLDENQNIRITNIEGHYSRHINKDLVVVYKNNKEGVYNTKGEKVLDIVYDQIRLIKGYFVIEKDHLLGLADVTGKILRDCQYYAINKNEDGFDLVTRKIVDKTERFVV